MENKNSINNLENTKTSKNKSIINTKIKFIFTIVLSSLVGVFNGLFGGGGGMLVVPILTVLCGLEAKKAHASAVLTILPLSIVSSIVYMLRGDFELKTGAFVGIGVVLGGIIGTFVMKKFSNNFLSILFYLIMIFAGIMTIVTKI